jgi:dihydropteroate synthase
LNFAQFNEWLIHAPPRRPLLMGILNITPDSFSDGGSFSSVESAIAHVELMAATGADLIDVGGESTRPGSLPVSSEEQIRRIVTVIEAISRRIASVVISVDTTRADVARAAVSAGATVINDISAGRDDPAMLPFVAEHQLPIILMHMQGTPKTMQQNPVYADVVKEVGEFLVERRQAAIAAGVNPAHVLLDPGIGFGKTDEHNLQLLRALSHLAKLGSPLLIGVSRKGFIGRITGEADAADRVWGTAAAIGWCVANGAGVSRVHDVDSMSKVVRMVRAIVGHDGI